VTDPSIYPFRFNFLKHHLAWLCESLLNARSSQDAQQISEYIAAVSSFNSNYIDLYTGSLSPVAILIQIRDMLTTQKVLAKSSFNRWIGKKEFRKILLNDGSCWILRRGVSDRDYIHVHPARYTTHSVRVHGNSFKTALLLFLLKGTPDIRDLDVINEIRTTCLKLSPIRELQVNDKLKTASRLIQSHLRGTIRNDT
jgi:hypothetical protein